MSFEIRCVPTIRQVNCCCCTFSLKTATIIIGWLGVIGGISEILHGAITLATYDPKIHPRGPGNRGEVAFQAACIGQMLSGIITTLFHGLLIHGAMKEKVKVMAALVKLQLIGIILFTLYGIYSTYKEFKADYTRGVIMIVIVVVVLLIASLFWFIIYNFYRRLDEQENPRMASHLQNVAERGKLTESDHSM